MQEFPTVDALDESFRALFEVDLEREIQVQDAVADCMAEQGFDYVPFVDPSLQVEDRSTLSPATDSLESSAERFHAGRSGSQAGVADPNVEILTKLEQGDPSEAEAYRRALWGTSGGLSFERPDGGLESIDLSREALGCASRSALDVNGGVEGLNRSYTAIDLQNELDARIMADARYIAAVQNVSKCLLDFGAESLRTDFEVIFGETEEVVFDLDDVRAREVLYERARRAELAYEEIASECEDESNMSEIKASLREEYYDEVLSWYSVEGPGS